MTARFDNSDNQPSLDYNKFCSPFIMSKNQNLKLNINIEKIIQVATLNVGILAMVKNEAFMWHLNYPILSNIIYKLQFTMHHLMNG